MSLTSGTRFGSYLIEASLGTGGMGEVYRALDTRLHRHVALKVLAPSLADDPTRLERFSREARAVAALNHPHIVTIHSIEDADGVPFLTMELVEGQTLQALIPSGGLPLEQFFEIALPLADALSAAHAKHITHRDLKPSNVMITVDGRVKVLDFGLARIAAQPGGEPNATASHDFLTEAGTIVGTMPYMSPEQIGGGAVDHRSDIFSLGIMFFEMVTGSRPFTGDSSPLLMSSILRDTPPSASEVRADVPDELAKLISRCLEKRPEDRVQTAREIHGDLRRVAERPQAERRSTSETSAAPRASAREPGSDAARRSVSIAVEPFTVGSGDEQSGALAAGIGENVIAGFSRFPYLSVAGRRTAAARYVLEGSVRRAGSAIRVVVHVADTSSGAHLWAETYTRDLSKQDVFDLQDDVTDRIVSTVADPHGVLMRSIVERVRHQPVDQLGPRDLVLRYWSYDHKHSPGEHAQLRDAFEKAVEQHPHDAELWAAVARLAAQEYIFAHDPRPDPLGRALAAATRAVDLDPAGQFGWEALAITSFFRRDREGFVAAADRAVAINPRNANTLAWVANLYAHLGEVERAYDMAKRAMTINPEHPGWYNFVLWMYHASRGEWAETLQVAKRVNMPGHIFDPLVTAQSCVALGRMDEARAAFERLRAIAPDLAADREALGAHLEKWGWATGRWAEGIELLWKAAPPGVAGASVSAVVAPQRGIVVLPFANVGADRADDYFSDGLTEEVIADLSRVKALKVISRSSSLSLKGTTKDVRTIARELGVSHVIEGSVRKAGEQVRIAVQLVDAETDTQVWSQKFSGTVSDVFDVQERVAREIVAALDVRLTSDEHRVLTTRATQDPRIFEIALRARYEVRRATMESIARALEMLEHGFAIEPASVQLKALRAYAEAMRFKLGAEMTPEAVATAQGHAQEVFDLAPDSMFGHFALGYLAFQRGDQPGAVRHLKRAVEILPDPEALAFLSFSYLYAGQIDAARPVAQRLLGIDPLMPLAWVTAAVPDWFSGRAQESVASIERAVALERDSPLMRWHRPYTMLLVGRLDAATADAEWMLRVAPDFPYALQIAAMVAALRGDRSEACQLLDRLEPLQLDAHLCFHIGEAEALAGREARAMDLIARAVESGFYPYEFIARHNPFLDAVRSQPRFETIVADARRRWSDFQAP